MIFLNEVWLIEVAQVFSGVTQAFGCVEVLKESDRQLGTHQPYIHNLNVKFLQGQYNW